MESILHGDFFHHHDYSEHEHTHPHDNIMRPPAISLRTMSKSDPHLDIPHLIVSQDETHPSLNKIMSNLQHVHEGLKTPVMSHQNLEALRKENEFRGSSAALLSQEALTQPPLRKSSSAIDWNGAVVEATRKASRQHVDWQSVLFENSRNPSFSNLSLIGHSHNQQPTSVIASKDQSHQGGLVMSSLDNKKAMSTVSNPTQQSHFAQTLASSASSSSTSTPSATSAPPVLAHDAPQQEHRNVAAGVFGGMFHRGFFSKPVERTEEENYRYLMALDR